MDQRIRVLDELGESFQRLAESGERVEHRPWAGAVAVSATVAVALAVVLVIVISGPGARGPQLPRDTAATLASKRALLAQYAILRRPQTPADRAEAAAPPSAELNRPQRSGYGGGIRGGRSYFETVRITGLAPYRPVPGLTRVADVGGVTVSFFVEDVIPSRALPRATSSGNAPPGYVHAVTRQQLEADRDRRNAAAGYSLWVVVGHTGRPALIGRPPRLALAKDGICGAGSGRPCPGGPRRPRPVNLTALGDVGNASLSGPGGRIVAIVPDRVARVRWSWPREFDSSALSYEPAVSVSAAVHDNVAVAVAPARFASVEQIQPETVALYGPGGRTLIRASNPGGAARYQLTSTWDGSRPGPLNAQALAAQRDPSTPNRVVIAPNAPSSSSARGFFFHVLLNHRTYFLRVTGGPDAGCVRPDPADPSGGPGYGIALHPGDEPTVRGDTFFDSSPPGITRCPGSYRLSVSVLGPGGKPYPPFGSATFIVS